MVADLFDWRVAITGGAIVFMAVAFLLWVARPALRNLRVYRPGQSNTPAMAQSANSPSDMPSTSRST